LNEAQQEPRTGEETGHAAGVTHGCTVPVQRMFIVGRTHTIDLLHSTLPESSLKSNYRLSIGLNDAARAGEIRHVPPPPHNTSNNNTTMANVTDPLARAVHGTNPQNLIEYITRQKIYDSRYWKEECFGLNATDIVEKAVKLKTIGGSYGANNKPTHFSCLLLKMLQIQPEDEIIEQLIQDDTFKYVRALACMYLRLTGRPKDIYVLLEPLYHDYAKVNTAYS